MKPFRTRESQSNLQRFKNGKKPIPLIVGRNGKDIEKSNILVKDLTENIRQAYFHGYAIVLKSGNFLMDKTYGAIDRKYFPKENH